MIAHPALSQGDLQNVYSGVMMSNNLPFAVEQGLKLTPKEERIHSLLKLVNDKKGLEELKAFYAKEGENLLSEDVPLKDPDFHFPSFVLQTREQILSLKLKYQELCLANDAIYVEMGKMNKLIENLMKQTEEYNRVVLMFHIQNETPEKPDTGINEAVDKQIAQIRVVLNAEEEKAQENETQISRILHIIQLLKQVITIPPEELETSPGNKPQESELATKAVCVICASRSIEFCLSSCGHCFCGVCVDNIKNNCHVCRALKSTKIKLYYD